MENKGYYLWGMDISLKNTGLSIYDLEKGEFIHIESFNTEKIKNTYEYKNLDLNSLKIGKIKEWILKLKEQYPPYYVAIEEMVLVKRQYGYNINEIKGIAKATGTIQSCLWDVPMSLYYPTEVKKAVVSGNASKAVVQERILHKFPNLKFNNEDESDSCAVAICHLINVGILEFKEKKAPKTKKSKSKTVDKSDT